MSEDGRKTKLGELLLAQGLLDDHQLNHALAEHRRTGLMLGKVIIKLGFVTQETLESLLGTQIHLKQRKRLGEILLEQGLLIAEDLEKALDLQKESGQKLGQCLVKLGFISEDGILEILAAQLDYPQVKLENFTIESDTVALIPEEMARRHKVVALYEKEGVLTLAMTDPSDERAIEFVRFKTRLKVDPVIATERDIIDALEKLYGSTSDTLSSILAATEGVDLETVESEVEPDEIELTDEEGQQVVKIVNSILHEAVGMGASDIHLEPQETYLQLRYRLDGDLFIKPSIPGRIMGQVLTRIKLLAKMNIAEKRKPQDGRFTIRYRGKEVDFRVSSFPSMLRKRGVSEKIVMRILDPDGNTMGLDGMALHPENLDAVKKGIYLPNGIILVTGPTGSGKSTTLYACIKEINRPEVNISTMEDPVELNLEGVTQGQINNAAGFTFAAGMRALLRQDPDIVLLGEMRDTETATMAIEAALTGHMVLSTLHTNDAAGSFPRLLEMGLEPFLVTSAIKGVLAQRLVKRMCKGCAEEIVVEQSTRDRLRIEDEMNFFSGKGCNKCDGTGYKGRLAIHEFMVPNETVRNLVLKHSSGEVIKRAALAECNMISLRRDGLIKAAAGLTTLEEVLFASNADYDD
jgi:type IV pilus assembly protein PilB